MNVLYITADALRADHVNRETMPRMRKFLDESINYRSCYANGPGTPWSFPGLLSSRYSGATDGFGIPDEADPHPTLAEILTQEGFSTAGFTDNRFASSDYNYHRGMSEMVDEGATSNIKRGKQIVREGFDHDGIVYQSLLRGYHLIDDVLLGLTGKNSRFTRSEDLISQLLPWISQQESDWFAWFHPMDVHAPYEAPADYQRSYLDEPIDRRESQKLARKATHHPRELSEAEWETQRLLYKAECAYLDDQLGHLLESLDRSVLEQTIIVFTADHGEMLGEHGLGGHPQQFWEEVIHVPCGISVPGWVPQNIDKQTSLIDLPPTILDALGFDSPPEWDGRSQFPTEEGVVTGREHVFVDVGAELNQSLAGLRRADGWKLMRHSEEGELLLNVSKNPEESPSANRVEVNTGIYEELSQELDLHLDEMERRREGDLTGIEDQEMIEDHLKELGYLE